MFQQARSKDRVIFNNYEPMSGTNGGEEKDIFGNPRESNGRSRDSGNTTGNGCGNILVS